jgi:hypothetical protein
MGCAIYMGGVVVQMITGIGDVFGCIVAGRLIAGIGVGFESAIVIFYMSEIVRIPPISFFSRKKLTFSRVLRRFAERSFPGTNSVSLSVCFWPLALSMPPRIALILAPTVSLSASNSPGS